MKRPDRCRPLTKSELLPMPANTARALSLEHHVALSVIRNGQGNIHQFACLAKITYATFFMRDVTHGDINLETLRRAESAVERCLESLENGIPYTLHDDEIRSFEEIAALHDAQLSTVPLHHYVDASTRVHRRFVSGETRSPIPPAD
ncbi:hypothetical protein [Burkholderia diffusa]|uniref:hypothetical protein n=1 Tax=Burkholderia diffusa TaxID=488732 RepID=UPI0012D8E454|nr:hypothetical protein [Burkholderia diffusa]